MEDNQKVYVLHQYKKCNYIICEEIDGHLSITSQKVFSADSNNKNINN